MRLPAQPINGAMQRLALAFACLALLLPQWARSHGIIYHHHEHGHGHQGGHHHGETRGGRRALHTFPGSRGR